MKVPDKLYISKNIYDNFIYQVPNPDDKTEVEYIRIDAFVEKACEWLNKELPITDLSPSNMLDIAFKVFDKECKKVFIEDFKKYMKEE